MGNTPEILTLALKVLPEEVCLVPENRREITTEGGLDAAGQFRQLEATVKRLQAVGVRVSLFIEPAPHQIEAAARLRVEMVERQLWTRPWASTPPWAADSRRHWRRTLRAC